MLLLTLVCLNAAVALLVPLPAPYTQAMQLAEHELSLVTTSATCDAMFASVLDSMSEDYGSAGDGMASPLADIRAAAEQLAAEVRGSSIASDWNPASSSGGFSAAPGSRHALEQLMAQADYTALSGSNGSSREASNVMARVQALQQQIKAAATKAAAGSTASSGSSGIGAKNKSGSNTAASAAAAAKSAASKAAVAAAVAAAKRSTAANKAAATAGSSTSGSNGSTAGQQEPSLLRGQPPLAASYDEDACGDASAMPVIPGFGSSLAATAGLSFGRSSGAAATKAASKPSYPVYSDPASTWLAADSADGKQRIITIKAPASLAAAVAGARASSDLTTFESYSLGAKINKALYTEANALYNRWVTGLFEGWRVCWGLGWVTVLPRSRGR